MNPSPAPSQNDFFKAAAASRAGSRGSLSEFAVIDGLSSDRILQAKQNGEGGACASARDECGAQPVDD